MSAPEIDGEWMEVEDLVRPRPDRVPRVADIRLTEAEAYLIVCALLPGKNTTAIREKIFAAEWRVP